MHCDSVERVLQIRAEHLLKLICNMHELDQTCGPLTESSTALLYDSVPEYEVMQLSAHDLMVICESIFAQPGDAAHGS